MRTLTLKPEALTLPDLRAVWQGEVRIELAPDAWAAVEASNAAVSAIVAKGAPAYGINTGFGKLASSQIANDQLAQLQTNLIRSHSVGVGAPMEDRVVRLIVVTKIASLARGFSGIRRSVLETMIAVFNAGIVPVIPSKGSVGASGDLAPLSHMTLALMGEGRVRVDGVDTAGRRRAGRGRYRTDRSGRQGRSGADQWHAGLHRADLAGVVPDRARVCLGGGGRRLVGGCGQRLDAPFDRAFMRYAASPARSMWRRITANY